MRKSPFYLYLLLTLLALAGCKSYSKFALPGSTKIDLRLLGIWKTVEDTDRANFILVQDNMGKPNLDNNIYFVSYFNKHGIHPIYEHYDITPTIVKNQVFLSIPFSYIPLDKSGFHLLEEQQQSGYIIVKLISVSQDTVTTALVSDTTLKSVASSSSAKSRIGQNINNKFFYSDTLHFYKVSDYHSDFDEAMKRANP